MVVTEIDAEGVYFGGEAQTSLAIGWVYCGFLLCQCELEANGGVG
jgi:hypothetical protein